MQSHAHDGKCGEDINQFSNQKQQNMKKLFLLLGSTAAMFSGTAQTDFQLLTDATGKVVMKVTMNPGGGEATENIGKLNINYELVKEGDKETGAGYEYRAVYKEVNVPKNTNRYALLTIITTSWNEATITAQLCDENGTVPTATSDETIATARTDEGAQAIIDVLNTDNGTGKVTGTASKLTPKKLQGAMQQNEGVELEVEVNGTPAGTYKVASLVKENETTWAGTTQILDQKVIVAFSDNGGSISYGITLPAAAPAS